MTDFHDREQGFEAKFAHDEALKFKIEARACKLMGLWAAGLMGIAEGEDAQSYARDLARADLREAGSQDMLRQLRLDLDAKGIDHKPLNLEKKLAECTEQARLQLTQV